MLKPLLYLIDIQDCIECQIICRYRRYGTTPVGWPIQMQVLVQVKRHVSETLKETV